MNAHEAFLKCKENKISLINSAILSAVRNGETNINIPGFLSEEVEKYFKSLGYKFEYSECSENTTNISWYMRNK